MIEIAFWIFVGVVGTSVVYPWVRAYRRRSQNVAEMTPVKRTRKPRAKKTDTVKEVSPTKKTAPKKKVAVKKTVAKPVTKKTVSSKKTTKADKTS